MALGLTGFQLKHFYRWFLLGFLFKYFHRWFEYFYRWFVLKLVLLEIVLKEIGF